MQIKVSKLREALKLLEPVVPKKGNLEVIKYVFLGDGKAKATNLEVYVSVNLPEASDPMLLPVKTALSFLEYIPGFRMASLTSGKNNVAISVGDTEAQWVTKGAEDFPPTEQREFEHDAVLNGEAMVKAMATVRDCAASDDKRPVLHSVCLVPGENIEVVTADGFQLAIEKVPGKLPGERPLIIPLETVGLLERLWKHAAEPDLSNVETVAQLAMAKRLIRLEYNDTFLQLHFGRVTMLSQLIHGTFPNYSQLIPTDFTSAVTFQAEDMMRAVAQVATIARDASGITRLKWEGDWLTISARAAEVGESSVLVAARCTSPEKIAFNSRYLQNYLSSLQGEVTISKTSPQGPGLFSHRKSTRVVMPMFIEWEGNGQGEKTGESHAPEDDLGGNQETVDQINETGKEQSANKPKRRGRKAVKA